MCADAALAQSGEDATVLGRSGVPEEIEDAAVFSSADRSSYVTGQVLYVDGGWRLHRNPEGARMQVATTKPLS